MELAEKLYVAAQDIEPLLDDRDMRIGAKLKDMDLIGIPIKMIIGSKGMKDNNVELKLRTTGESIMVPIDGAVKKVEELLK